MLATLVAAAVLVGGALGGVLGLVAPVVGMLLLDTSIQCGQMANQARMVAVLVGVALARHLRQR